MTTLRWIARTIGKHVARSNRPVSTSARRARCFPAASAGFGQDDLYLRHGRPYRHATIVASRPRFGGDSQARTLQLVWTSWRETQLGRNQLDRLSWTGTSYSHETGTRPTGFSYVYKDFFPCLNSRNEIFPDECPKTTIPIQTVTQVAR